MDGTSVLDICRRPFFTHPLAVPGKQPECVGGPKVFPVNDKGGAIALPQASQDLIYEVVIFLSPHSLLHVRVIDASINRAKT